MASTCHSQVASLFAATHLPLRRTLLCVEKNTMGSSSKLGQHSRLQSPRSYAHHPFRTLRIWYRTLCRHRRCMVRQRMGFVDCRSYLRSIHLTLILNTRFMWPSRRTRNRCLHRILLVLLQLMALGPNQGYAGGNMEAHSKKFPRVSNSIGPVYMAFFGLQGFSLHFRMESSICSKILLGCWDSCSHCPNPHQYFGLWPLRRRHRIYCRMHNLLHSCRPLRKPFGQKWTTPLIINKNAIFSIKSY